MQFFLTVAWRNLWRNKRRSLITAMAMAVAIALCMWLLTLNAGFYVKFEEILIDQKLGHIQIQHPSYNTTKALQDAIPKAQNVIDSIRSLPDTQKLSARLKATALAGSSERSTGALISGVYPKDERQISTLHEQLVTGTYLSDTPQKEVIIGFELQEELKLKTGDELFLFTQGADGSMAYDLLNIKGVYKSGSVMLDRGAVMHLEDMQNMLSMQGQVHEIIVLSHNKENDSLLRLSALIQDLLIKTQIKVYEYPTPDDFTPQTQIYDPQYGKGTITHTTAKGLHNIKFSDKERQYSTVQLRSLELLDAKVKKSDAQVGVRTWWQSDPTAAEMMSMRDIASGVMLFLIFFISGFGILNTMLMSVFERTRELGILKALGLRPGRIVLLIVTESVLLSLVSAVLGLILGALLSYLMITRGFDISGGTGEPIAIMGANIDPIVYGHIDPKEVLLPLLALFVIAILAALWPAVRAARLKPVDAIRQD